MGGRARGALISSLFGNRCFAHRRASLQIRALSLYYKAPIIVVQAGTDMVEHGSDFPRERAMLIS